MTTSVATDRVPYWVSTLSVDGCSSREWLAKAHFCLGPGDPGCGRSCGCTN
ncbi:hypothetical protein [Leptolyngbya sp. Heron Island J]|uniref:hypothetical protein n=1 Tax=Leptolyngbya sp. Heron Island J TaxID=1385935 RepID=UPI00137846AB|nr:hypothetical protein [Leptolyngbya sp. Heron Island J]